MAQPPLLTLRDVRLAFGGAPLFSGVSFTLARGERAALVGRNGAGKSTLMRLIAGVHEADQGEIWLQPGTTVATVPQEPNLHGYARLIDYVADGIEDRHRAEAELTEAGLAPAANPATLSGGQARRAAIARAFATDPGLLLMDEPTNHLDVPMIERLEARLRAFRGALLVVSHDRRFLERVSTNTIWLRGGEALKSPKGYAHFETWAEQVEAEEEQRLARMRTQLKNEQHWLARGVTARRKRNQGRLARLKQMRAEHAALRGSLARSRAGAALGGAEIDTMSKKAIEVKGLTKAFKAGDTSLPVVTGLDLIILRGDRLGIIGPNGAGKTTLIKLLLGELEPDAGRVKRAKSLSVTYLDQTRDSLKAADTLWETLAPNGGDTIMVQGRPRHVAGYAKDFLFDPVQLRQPVGALSGGERNRLTLAVALARPTSLLVLDEPTNDLDMQTLDLLEEMLAAYEGTLILVSHDRAFLDATVTSCLVPLGGGKWVQTAGGWSDAEAQLGASDGDSAVSKQPSGAARSKPPRDKPRPARKLSFKDQHRLEELNDALPRLGEEIEALEATLAEDGAYGRDPAGFQVNSEQLAALKAELAMLEEEWLEIETRREALLS